MRKTFLILLTGLFPLILLTSSVVLGQTRTHSLKSRAAPEGELQIIEFTFDAGLEGWTTGHMGGEYDSAEWSDDHGNPPGSVRLDGSDLGASDGQPNSWMSRSVALPANFDLLYFETKANVDGALRVRVVDDGGASHTLMPWEVLAGDSWRERTADITAFAGQSVTLIFEQGDNDVGNGEHRYVDNVILCESAILSTVEGSDASANCVQPSLGEASYLPFFTLEGPLFLQPTP